MKSLYIVTTEDKGNIYKEIRGRNWIFPANPSNVLRHGFKFKGVAQKHAAKRNRIGDLYKVGEVTFTGTVFDLDGIQMHIKLIKE